MLAGAFDHSIIKRARDRGIVDIQLHDLRDHTDDRHRTVDDYPYGGGAGMVMKPEPWFRAVESLRVQGQSRPSHPAHSPGQTAGPATRPTTRRRRSPDHPLRALRGRRRASPRTPRRRGNLNRRLRPLTAANRPPPCSSMQSSASSRERWARQNRRSRKPSARICSSTRTTPDRPNSAVGESPTSSSAATTAPSIAGAVNSKSNAPAPDAQTCWDPNTMYRRQPA